MCDREKVKKRRAQLRMPSPHQRIEKHGSAADKKLPPQLPRFFKRLRAKWTHAETLTFERPRRIAHRLASLRSDRAIVFKEADGNSLQIFQRLIPEPDRRAHRIQSILSGESDEEQREIADGARHGPDRAENRKRPIARGQMTARREYGLAWA